MERTCKNNGRNTLEKSSNSNPLQDSSQRRVEVLRRPAQKPPPTEVMIFMSGKMGRTQPEWASPLKQPLLRGVLGRQLRVASGSALPVRVERRCDVSRDGTPDCRSPARISAVAGALAAMAASAADSFIKAPKHSSVRLAES
jgi:hypothetical protein